MCKCALNWSIRTESHTFAVSNTLLNGHVSVIEARAENKSVGVAILVTTRVDERLELIQTRRKLNVPRLRGGNNGKRRRSDERPLPGHNESRECSKLLAKLRRREEEKEKRRNVESSAKRDI